MVVETMALLFALAIVSAALLFVIGAVKLCSSIIGDVRKRKRRRKVAARIMKQAKALGVWNPQALGGKGLELYAWEEYRFVRIPGETDQELRRRCMDMADKMNLQREGRKDE